jgi:hypothetical protein
MPQLHFRQFCRLDFIQSINIEDQFVPVLRKWDADLRRLGLNLDGLKNDDPSARRVLDAFTAKERLPGDLLELLYMLDDLADEQGDDRLRALVAAEGVEEDIPGLDGDLSYADTAILIYRHKPEILTACHDEATPRKVCKYIEWRAANAIGLTLSQAKRRKQRVEREMAAWFASKGRGRVCDVHVFQDNNELRFVITHGQNYRSQGSYTPDLKRSRSAFRPQRHDLAIWDPRRRVLLVHASTRAEQQQYRSVFGQVYWGSTTYFQRDDIYNLAVLQRHNFTLSQAYGVTASRLVEVITTLDDAHNTRQVTTGSDLLASAREQRAPNLARGTIVSAGFLLSYESGGRPRRLDIRMPNIADYDRDRDGIPARAWLEANRFLVESMPAADVEDDDDTEDDDGSVTAVAGR